MSEVHRSHLYQETHARPYLSLPVPCAVGHILYWRGDQQSSQLLDLAKHLAERQGVSQSSKHTTFFEYTCQNYHIRFEQHTEFDTLTIAQSISAEAELFGDNPLSIIEDGWLTALEPNLLVKTRIHLLLKAEPDDGIAPSVGQSAQNYVGAQFSDINGSAAIYGSWIMGRRAEAYSDFKLDAQGYSRYLVVSHALNADDAGRVITRLLEMENYRITALIPLNAARAVSKSLSKADAQLVQILDEIADSDSAQKQHDLLNELLAIAQAVESHRNQLSSRFSASQAYYELVKFSYEKLNEEKLGGLQRLQTFVERRLGPAIRTFGALRHRLEDISQRVDRIAELLRTEINVHMQLQNSAMLAGMNHSAKMQLKMQKTVEGISIVALTYYAIGVIGYLLAIFLHGDDKYTVMGLLVLPVAALIWYLQKKILHRINAATHLDE